MANLALIVDGVNLRADPSTSAAVKLHTSAPADPTVTRASNSG